MQNDRDVTMHGHCVSRTIHLGDHGSQNIRKGTHPHGTSRHPTILLEEATERWGDATSRNDVSVYEFSGSPGPQIN